MLIDTGVSLSDSLQAAEAAASTAEADGFDGISVPETRHDPFIALALAARATSTITLRSEIVVAFARNPMTVAAAANARGLLDDAEVLFAAGRHARAYSPAALEWRRSVR